MSAYSYYSGQPAPQALGAAMMPMDVQNAGAPSGGSPMGGVPQMTPQQLQAMMQSGQFAPGYADNAGVSGSMLNQAGIAPGYGGGGLMGLGGAQMTGSSGNQLFLSPGSQFNPADMQALQGAFNG